MLLLGCRDLKGDSGSATPSSPFVEVDLGDPINNLGLSKASAQPNGANPNFGEVIRLKVQIPQDPLFAQTMTLRVKDSKFGGRLQVGYQRSYNNHRLFCMGSV